jgi:hypothetical protein
MSVDDILEISNSFLNPLSAVFKDKKKAFFMQILFRLFFEPEDGDELYIRNVYMLSTYYTALNPRTYKYLTYITSHLDERYSTIFCLFVNSQM